MRKTIAVLVVLSATAFPQEPSKHAFPTPEEIRVVLAQAEVALEQYKNSFELEMQLPSVRKNSAKLDSNKERITLSEGLISKLKTQADAFNSAKGLVLNGFLDQAARQAALCGYVAMGDVSVGFMDNKMDGATASNYTNIGKVCVDASIQLDAVASNVHDLLIREMEAQEELNQQGKDALGKCAEYIRTHP